MPIYEYVCDDCTHAFEVIVHREADARCPQCDGTTLARQLSVFAVGSGERTPTGSSAVAPCGTCGDVRGAGACSMN